MKLKSSDFKISDSILKWTTFPYYLLTEIVLVLETGVEWGTWGSRGRVVVGSGNGAGRGCSSSSAVIVTGICDSVGTSEGFSFSTWIPGSWSISGTGTKGSSGAGSCSCGTGTLPSLHKSKILLILFHKYYIFEKKFQEIKENVHNI
jgi:hypothetical protein